MNNEPSKADWYVIIGWVAILLTIAVINSN